MTDTLGIDIGRVIIAGDSGPADTNFFTGDHLRTPAMAGALESIARLVESRFGDDVHLISKCHTRVENRTREWLAHMRFAELTGIPEERWHFCKERKDKGPLCARLEITHFIDDRIENLRHAGEAGVEHLYWFAPNGEPDQTDAPEHIRVRSWDEVVITLAGNPA